MTKLRKSFIIDIILIALAAVFAAWVNRGIEIKGLYMDDLYMWSCYGEQSLMEFAFPIGTSTRFRPVYWLMTYLEMAVIGTHVERFVAVNIFINVLAAILIYCIVRRIVRSRVMGRSAGFISMILYLASRFAYYQIGQALGLMETMALIFALFILYELYSFAVAGAGRRSFFAALIAYFLIAFTHERYIALFPLFYLALILRRPKEKSKAVWLLPLALLILIAAIRSYAIGAVIPAGTGGTFVTETFSMREALSYCFAQILYIFGVNAGPDYLAGITWADTAPGIKGLVKLSVIFIGILCVFYAAAVIIEAARESRDRLRIPAVLRRELSAAAVWMGFIALCIGSSSVTIRLEMRWIYVSYAAALIYASYMLGRTADLAPRTAYPALIALAAYALLSLYVNVYYRGYFPNIYFWENQERMNSLYDETIGRYGTEGIFGKNIYIIGNSYEMTDFYAETFFKPYDPERTAAGTRIIFTESITGIPAEEIREGSAIALIEVPDERGYRDITDELK